MPVRRAFHVLTGAAPLRQERGAMSVALTVLTGSMLLTFAAFAAVGGDLPLARGDQDRKEAYSAAEAGINYYLYHLNQDNAYWTKCTNVPPPGSGEPSPVVQAWNGSGTDTRTGHWRKVQGSDAEYAIELLPAPGQSQCVEGNQQSMLDPQNGAFRIRSTGRLGKGKRSIVAAFKRKGFLDYLYYTDYETLDPGAFIDPDDQTYASNNCVKHHSEGRTYPCRDIRFITGDTVAGPLHTNDSILVCGTPVFGRTTADIIEVSGPNPGWWSNCSGSPNFVGTWKYGAPPLDSPPTAGSLASIAASNYRFTGTTTIVLTGTTMSVTNANLNGGQPQTMNIPSNGVVWVENGSCTNAYRSIQNYNDPVGCANVYIRGDYSRSLTVGSRNDIIINGNLNHSGDAMLGLIPENFARIYHPVTGNNGGSCTNASGTMQDVEIDAAILSLRHSFIVDNYYCGAPLGTLTVNGAIAQEFRGPVGTGGSSNSTGYLKDYEYDDRFRYRAPPHFLDPVQTAWTIRRQTEQVPAR